MESIFVKEIQESYYELHHKSGLTLLLAPRNHYSTVYAQMTARYGSLDTRFRLSPVEQYAEVPEGIAHFLEHKLFENEDGDAFLQFSKTGADANAFTSFDRTSYEVTCSSDFLENLRILIHMVTHPYFTEESVKKEQGIIGQEILMYQDDPDWKGYFNLMGALYIDHPVRIDIAGTVESISHIDHTLLYQCYDTFYNLHNMVLTVCGGFDPQEVIALCDEMLPPAQPVDIDRAAIVEPRAVRIPYVEERLPISIPSFELGFKNAPLLEGEERSRQLAAHDILLEILAGGSSPLFAKLYESGLITDSFSFYSFEERGLFASIFSGESKEPQAVAEIIVQAATQLRKNGIGEEEFLRCQKSFYGKSILALGSIEPVAQALTSSFIEKEAPFSMAKAFAKVTKEEVEKSLFEDLDERRMALSVILPNLAEEK